MKDFDTIYLFVKDRWKYKKMKAGKASSQVAHAVGLLASGYPNLWRIHINNGQRAVALKCREIPKFNGEVKLDRLGNTHLKKETNDIYYASVYDYTDSDIFVLAVLPQKRLDMPQYTIL